MLSKIVALLAKVFTVYLHFSCLLLLALLFEVSVCNASTISTSWTRDLGAGVWSSPAVSNTKNLYIATEKGILHAFSNSGDELWQYGIQGSIFSSPAILSDGRVVIGSSDGFFYAIDKNGKLSWKFYVGSDVDGSAAIDESGVIYIGANNGLLYALSSQGDLIWQQDLGAMIDSSVAIAPNGALYIGTRKGTLFALERDGSLLWQRELGSISSSPAVGHDGTIYVGSWDNSVYAYASDGTLQWRYVTDSWVWGSPLVGPNGTVYVGALDGAVYAIDSDGVLKWRYQTGALIDSSPLLDSQEVLYIGSRDKYFYAIDAVAGELKWRYEVQAGVYSSSVIDSAGGLYVATVKGTLFAFSAEGRGLADSSWPTKGNNAGNTGAPTTAPGGYVIDFESGDLMQAQFKNDTNFPWYVEGDSDLNNSFSLHSPTVYGDDNTSVALTSHNMPGLLSFDYCVLNESGGSLSLIVNDEIAQTWNSAKPASRFVHRLNKGVNKLEWKYTAGQTAVSQAEVIIDNIRLPTRLVGLGQDLTGDGKDDLILRRPMSKENIVVDLTNNAQHVIELGSNEDDIPLLGDLEGDGRNELWMRMPSTGFFSFNNNAQAVYFGFLSSDIPIPGDYDGDGKTDIAVRRPDTGQFIIRLSSTLKIKRYRFGLKKSDIPIPADYDGDGITDLAIRRPETSQFIIRFSQSGGIVWNSFGALASDIPIPADYDGDGIADLAFFREESDSGTWIIKESGRSDNFIRRVAITRTSKLLPLVADFNHDSKTDIAFYDIQHSSIQIWDNKKRKLIKLAQTEYGDVPLSLPIMQKMALIKKYEFGSDSLTKPSTLNTHTVIDGYQHAELLGEQVENIHCNTSSEVCH